MNHNMKRMSGVVTVMFLSFTSNINASNIDVSICLENDGSCLVKCGQNEKLFSNINELSSSLNYFTGDYLNISSVNTIDNIYNNEIKNNKNRLYNPVLNSYTIKSVDNEIVFNGIQNKIPCNISLKSNFIKNELGPRIIFNCSSNGASFPHVYVKTNILLFLINGNSSNNVSVGTIHSLAATNSNASVFVNENVKLGNAAIGLYDNLQSNTTNSK